MTVGAIRRSLLLTLFVAGAVVWPEVHAVGHFAAPHTHTGTVLHQVYEEFGIQTTIVQGQNTYTQNRTTVKDARFKSKYCDDTGFPGWVLLGCTYQLENMAGHVGMFTYGEWYHNLGIYYVQRAHFHAFASGSWSVWCDLSAGALPPRWFSTCSGSRS